MHKLSVFWCNQYGRICGKNTIQKNDGNACFKADYFAGSAYCHYDAGFIVLQHGGYFFCFANRNERERGRRRCFFAYGDYTGCGLHAGHGLGEHNLKAAWRARFGKSLTDGDNSIFCGVSFRFGDFCLRNSMPR